MIFQILIVGSKVKDSLYRSLVTQSFFVCGFYHLNWDMEFKCYPGSNKHWFNCQAIFICKCLKWSPFVQIWALQSVSMPDICRMRFYIVKWKATIWVSTLFCKVTLIILTPQICWKDSGRKSVLESQYSLLIRSRHWIQLLCFKHSFSTY